MAQTKLGGSKVAATKLGISVEEYLQNVKSGLKWCFSCRTWLPADFFSRDRTTHDGKDNRCKTCRKAVDRQRYERIPPELRRPRGFPPKPARDGDKNQARARVNYAVARNKLPHARNIPCVDCGHIGDDRSHEYDHYKGYDGVNHLEVQCVCVPCHFKRERQRQQQQKQEQEQEQEQILVTCEK